MPRSKVACLLVLVVGLARASAAHAQPAGEDYLFPRGGRLGATFATGVPYVAIADATLGFGPYAALGALFGVTPRVVGLGLRPRLALPLGTAHSARLRLYAIAPLLYYPSTDSGAQWVLARPTLALEDRVADDVRVALGGGLLWASSVGALQGEAVPLSYEAPSEAEIASRRAASTEGSGSVLFWTLTASGALRVTEHDSVFLEVTTVMENAGLAGPRWTDFGGPPVTFALGITHSL